jgi:glycosyltransferase involved in cell wall biosynthesis
MKIGVLIDRLNVGGVEKTAIQEVIAMRSLGSDATLLVLSRRAVVEGAHKDLLKGIPVEYLDDRLPDFLKFTFKFPIFAFFSFFHISYAILLPFVVKCSEFDHIVSHSSYTTITAIMIKWFRKIPYSIYFWDPAYYIVKRVYRDDLPKFILDTLTFLARFLDRVLVRSADYVFAAGDTHNDYFINGCGCPKDHVVVVNPGTPLNRPIKKKEDHVLMVTTWKAGKHPEYVLEIVEALPKVKIKMVGGWLDKEMLKTFKQKMKQKKMEDNIELVGEADEKMLAKLYPVALVHLTTNLEKGFGMPTLEAAASGTTFIVPKGSGVCSVFTDKVDGFFTPEKDTKKIVGAITKLLKDKQKAIEMGQSAYNKAKDGFSWEAHSQKILNAIEK